MNAKQTLAQWLADGDLERALHGLRLLQEKWRTKSLGNHEFNAIAQLGRYHTLETARSNGTVSHDNYSAEIARIRGAVAEIIQWLPDDRWLEELATVPPSISAIGSLAIPRQRRSGAFWATLLAALGVLLALLAYLNDMGIFPKKADPPPLEQPAAHPSAEPLSHPAAPAPAAPKNQTNIQVKDKAKVGNIITGDSNNIHIKQDF